MQAVCNKSWVHVLRRAGYQLGITAEFRFNDVTAGVVATVTVLGVTGMVNGDDYVIV